MPAMPDPADDVTASLDRISEGIEEARAAVAVAAEGDPGAWQELDAVVDALARELGELKARTAARF
jgi:hypothetical protein